MFVRDFIEIPLPFEAVAPLLVRNAAWLEPIAQHAVEEAIATRRALHPDQAVPAGVPLEVRCARGPVRIRADALVMALRWEINPPVVLLSTVDGDLEVVPLGADRSQIGLDANTSARPSDGDVLTRRVIETSLRVFLSRLAASLRVPS
jgi:hypothetical protein